MAENKNLLEEINNLRNILGYITKDFGLKNISDLITNLFSSELDYCFIKDNLELQEKLTKHCQRMTLMRLKLIDLSDEELFDEVCRYCYLQMEGLINYYLNSIFHGNIKELKIEYIKYKIEYFFSKFIENGSSILNEINIEEMSKKYFSMNDEQFKKEYSDLFSKYKIEYGDKFTKKKFVNIVWKIKEESIDKASFNNKLELVQNYLYKKMGNNKYYWTRISILTYRNKEISHTQTEVDKDMGVGKEKGLNDLLNDKNKTYTVFLSLVELHDYISTEIKKMFTPHEISKEELDKLKKLNTK